MTPLQRFLTVLSLIVLTFGLTVSDAEAARLGGGKSFGMSRNSSTMQRQAAPTRPAAPTQAAPAPATPPTPAPAPQPARSGMWGMLGGLALGAGLGALFAHFGGFGGGGFGGLLTLLLVVGGVILMLRLVARRMPSPAPSPVPAYAGGASAGTPPEMPASATAPATAATPTADAPTVPAGFDVDAFQRQAKLNFVRLQTANDAGNMADIKTFVTPEFFAEVEMQYLERGKSTQQTDIVQLDAQLLEVVEEAGQQIASVRFGGLLRESADATPAAFAEVWHLVRPADGRTGWVVAGIQQLS